MANNEPIEKLKEGVHNWNEWRKQNYDVASIGINVNLSDANLEGADLKGANLQGANLKGANLQGANLKGAFLQVASFDGADLSGADLKGANLEGVGFDGANLQGANLKGANLEGKYLSGANLQGANLKGAILQGADLSGANLQGANLKGAILWDADLSGANLSGAHLPEANLSGADLNGANLSGADLKSANLEGVDLKGADLECAALSGANLWYADLNGANLEGADLRRAKNILLDNARIKDAQFSNRAPDPWSVLRSTYTGSKFTFLLLGLIVFVLPYIGKIGFWSFINRGQGYTEGLLETIRERAYAQGINDQTITELGLSPEKITSLSQCLSEECEKQSVLHILLGVDQGGLYWMLPTALIIYNILRGVLTYLVSPMRDEEERSGYSPVWVMKIADRENPKVHHKEWWQGYRVLFYAHRMVFWLGFIAFAAFVINAYHWMFQWIYLPV